MAGPATGKGKNGSTNVVIQRRRSPLVLRNYDLRGGTGGTAERDQAFEEPSSRIVPDPGDDHDDSARTPPGNQGVLP